MKAATNQIRRRPVKRHARRPVGKARRRLLPLIFILIVFSAAIIGILSLPIWKVTGVVIKGNKIVTNAQIMRVLDLLPDENIFYIRTGILEKKIKNIPQVKEAKAVKRLPNLLVFEVFERQPYATLVASQETVVIDQEGVVLWDSRQQNPNPIANIDSLPVVTGVKKEFFGANGNLSPNVARIVAGSINGLAKFSSLKNLNLEFASTGDFSLIVNDVIDVRMGNLDQIEKKFNQLSVILPRFKERFNNIDYIDLRVADDPVIKFR